MCYAEESGRSSVSESLDLEQLKTVFYSLLAIELMGFAVGITENVVKRIYVSRSSLIGFAIGIAENVVKRVSASRSSETLDSFTSTFEGKNPIFCKSCSSSFVQILNQANSESEVILELKKLICEK